MRIQYTVRRLVRRLTRRVWQDDIDDLERIITRWRNTADSYQQDLETALAKLERQAREEQQRLQAGRLQYDDIKLLQDLDDAKRLSDAWYAFDEAFLSIRMRAEQGTYVRSALPPNVLSQIRQIVSGHVRSTADQVDQRSMYR